MTTTADMEHLTRSELWSAQLKMELLDEMQAQKYVRWLTEFPDGDTFTIPSISSQGQTRNYVEDTEVQFDNLDTGEFQFSITDYISSGNYITEKAKQDAFYSAQLEAQFVPSQARAIAAHVEAKIMRLHDQQTASNLNAINGASHRWVAGGTSNSIIVEDFAKARYALQKANVPMVGLTALVDPSVVYTLETQTNFVNMSNNPMWEGITTQNNLSGMKFVKNVYGFDVYVSNYIDDVASETIDGRAATNAKANLFFSAVSNDVCPFIGAWRQMPKVDSGFDYKKQRTEYVTTARYGVKLYRPENLVTVLTQVNV